MRKWIVTCVALAIAAPFAAAQQTRPPQTPYNGPIIPLNSPTVPTMNPLGTRMSVTNSLQMGYANNLGVLPGSGVYVPPRYVNSPGSTYIVNNYNNGTQNPFGVGGAGYQGNAMTGVTYMMMGGTPGRVSTNPWATNIAPMPQTWTNTTGVGPNGQPWGMPPGFGPGAMNPQFPQMINAPQVVGQANGFFPNQPPAIAQPVNQNNFGIQRIPGLNAPR